MARTTAVKVQGILLRDYPTVPPFPSLNPFIASATAIVSRVKTCETDRGASGIDTADIDDGTGVLTSRGELMERWVAAYLYTRSDPIYQSRSTAGRSGGFVADNDGTSVERYKAGALALDFHGCLASILKAQRAGAFWNGRPPSAQTDYADRD